MAGRKEQQWAAVLLVLALLGTTVSAAQKCDEGDLKALKAFKGTFHDPGSLFQTWKGTDCCDGWEGVNCTNSGRVSSLVVVAPFPTRGPTPSPKAAFTGLAGETLTDLTALKTLRILNVFFNGPLPDTFDNLQKLETLEFSFNNLSGSLPPSIGKAKTLRSLTINVNLPQGFDQVFEGGPLPESFCDLTQLETVALSASRLTGKIPSCICRWHKLTSLELSVNSLESDIPNCIGYSLTKLTFLALDHNNFTGPVPAMLGRLSLLEKLKLNDNGFSGALPASLGNLKYLQELTANDNKITGPIPEHFGELESLVELDLSYNYLTSIPAELGNLTKLTFLSLRKNKLQGRLPAEIGNAGSGVSEGLQLDVSHNILSGKLPFTLGSLASFVASNNFFYGPFAQSLAGVGYVDLSNNFLNNWGDIGPEPATYDIRILQLRNNRFAGQVPSWLSTILNKSRLITEVDISDNNFSGDITPLFQDAPELRLLNASHNLFKSKLPKSTFSAPEGSALDLSHNAIFGAIPSNFFPSFAGAQYIDISYNEVNGSLPNNIGKLDEIAYLDLSHNELCGVVPSIEDLLDTLQFLDLSFNNFTGAVPAVTKDSTVTFGDEF